jgi:hypothetical protein
MSGMKREMVLSHARGLSGIGQISRPQKGFDCLELSRR